MSLPAVRYPTPETPMPRLDDDQRDAPAGMLHFEQGLLGFPDCRRWELTAAGRDGLFWLQSVDHAPLAFLVCDPFACFVGYSVDVPTAAVHRLGARAPADLAVFAIITLPGPLEPEPTANLQGPVVINPRTRRGLQVVLPDSPWGVRHILVLP